MNTIRELKQQEKYKSMLKRKNKEKKIYKDKNASLQFEKQKLYRVLLNREKEIERLNNIIKELREMLEHKVEFHKNLDFYEDKELETQVYYNYVACLQDFNEIVEKYKLGK